MSTQHLLIVGAADQVKGRHQNTGRVTLAIRNEINQRLVERQWLNGATFSVVSLILRFGVEAKDEIEFQAIYEKNGQYVLPIAAQLSMSEIVAAQASDSAIEALVRPAIERSVRIVSERFGLEYFEPSA